MTSPYDDLPANAFWKTGVVEQELDALPDLYKRKFEITRQDAVATAGSCFAQHIARHLRSHDFRVLDEEPPPFGLTGDEAKRYGYNTYSARYANIYVPRQLLQLMAASRGSFSPQGWIWERNGRYFDGLRPNVEPDGLESPEEVIAHREDHLQAVKQMLEKVDVLVFTFGLTESWVHTESGTVFPTAPGTIAGEFAGGDFSFMNFKYPDLYKDFVRIRRAVKRLRPDARFVITVSPVPLTATASGDHVLAATIYSKSVLRAVAGDLASEFEDVDYFPSYELIASHVSRGQFYKRNLRSVSDAGVATAMRAFLAEHVGDEVEHAITPPTEVEAAEREDQDADVVCEEMLLEAFAR